MARHKYDGWCGKDFTDDDGNLRTCYPEDEESQMCPECSDAEHTYWAHYFGQTGKDLDRDRRVLDAMRPLTTAELEEVMAEARKLK